MTVKHLVIAIACVTTSLFVYRLQNTEPESEAVPVTGAQGTAQTSPARKETPVLPRAAKEREIARAPEPVRMDWSKFNGPVSKSPACKSKASPQTELKLTPDEVYQVYRNDRTYSKSIILDPFRFCLHVNTQVSVSDWEARGKIKILGMELIQIDKQNLVPVSKLHVAGFLDLQAWGALVLDFFQSYDFSPIKDSFRLGLFVTYQFTEKKSFHWDVAGSRKAPLISGVRYIDRSNLDQYSKDALIVDVRSQGEFVKGNLRKSVNLSYLIKDTGKLGANPNVLNIQENLWEYRRLPIDLRRPIVIYGQDAYDPRVWSAYLTLNLLRYRNLGWIYGGYSAIANVLSPAISVSDYPFAKTRIVNAEGLLRLSPLRPKIVYVGMKDLERNTFPEILRIPYFEKVPVSDKPSLNWVPFLKAGGDVFSFEKFLPNKSEVIVLTDQDDFSNRPLKAALWLQKEGYENIYIYPNGLNNLLALSLAIPEKVNCIILDSISKCK